MNYKSVSYILHRLQKCNRNQQHLLLNELTASINTMTSNDLQAIAEFVTIINDSNLEVKILSLLALCIASSDTHYEVIISYNPIYEKLEKILSRGLCLKSTVPLNFITALLCKDAEAEPLSYRNHLAVQARNMLRVSGCLRWIISYFTNSIVFLDTWKALCQCLAECCRDSPVNQDQCGHLVPLCIKKGLQGMIDAMIVLQSLLKDHSNNFATFLKYSGLQLFNKQNLQLTACLQLLSFVAQNAEVASALRESEVPNHIAEILHWGGPLTQKGQLCTIVLYHLNTNRDFLIRNVLSNPVSTHITEREKEPSIDINIPMPQNKINNEEKYEHNADNTHDLLRKVMQEVLSWKNEENNTPLNRNPRINEQPENKKALFKKRKTSPIIRPNEDPNNQSELSFNFLEEERMASKPRFQTVKSFVNYQKELNVDTTYTADVKVNSTSKILSTTTTESVSNYMAFKPTATSSPNRKSSFSGNVCPKNLGNYSLCPINKIKASSKYSQKIPFTQSRPIILQRKKIQRTRADFTVKKLTSRSMSTKLFDAVNETCTTIVKTVKDIFMPWKRDSTNERNEAKNTQTSFMEYMRKRDAILNSSKLDISKIKIHPQSSIDLCATCNDTKKLKDKFNSDVQLRNILKKLKIGINLYGCDFKKISKNLWPRETYMTPTVLYNLYRKLILK